MTARVILIDDDADVRAALAQTLDLAGIDVSPHGSFVAAKGDIASSFEGVVVTDIRMPGKDGFSVLDHAKGIDPDLPVIFLTGEGDVPSAVQAMSQGAYDYLEKPCPPKRLIGVVERALEQRKLVLENRALSDALATGDVAERRFLGSSEVAVKLRRQMRLIAGTDEDVLITGETGTGKELAARIIHALSRPGAPFVAVHCGMLTGDGVQSTLFGDGGDPGAFLRAQGGTLFLDEVGAMPLAQQVNLLRVLDDRVLTDARGREREVALRVMASTHSDLDAMRKAGHFRDDLYYRLDVVRLDMPPLRARREDIPLLFRSFHSDALAGAGRETGEPPAGVLAALMARDWPGNCRELRNHAKRAALGLLVEGKGDGTTSLSTQLEQIEAWLIREALDEAGGRVADAAERLQVPRKTLYDKMKRLGLGTDTA